MNLSELTKMYDFTGRTVVITGATGVLCSSMAQTLAACGANVALVVRNQEKGEQLAARLPGPGRALVAVSDALDRKALDQAVQTIVGKFGQIDGLINGAGGNHPKATARPDQSFFDLASDALRGVVDLNLMGTVFPCQAFGRVMAERGEGVILNISSMAALRPLTRIVGYSAAKAGVSNFTAWLAVHMAQEYSPRIRVNAIAPGFFLTEQNRAMLTDVQTGQLTARGQSIVSHTPMKRFGEPDELLGAVLWLLSAASAFVTGIVVPVDGGFSAFSGV
ncbi:MAG: SDR family oxidoreductase [Acidobacteria bacterium]|nr:SDR family oxidoreductase [Acidobacteriota bacterium]MCI0724562.1 SDR family oxidoreductase [Acidobacteriota bacterium]